LRFSKDKENAPLSHELQQLKYAEAVLKEEEKNNTFNEEKVKLLSGILSALGQRDVTKSPDGRVHTIGPNGEIDGTAGKELPKDTPTGQYEPRDITPPSIPIDQYNAIPTLTPRATTPSVQTVPPEQRSDAGTDSLGQSAETAGTKLSALGEAVDSLISKFAGAQVPGGAAALAAEAPPSVAAAGGGHVTGPGTATSDSIPAMLSDGEYVLKKEAVDREGIETLHAVNQGLAHFAGGGNVESEYADPNDTGNNPYGYYADPRTNKLVRRRKKHSQFVGSYDRDDQANYSGGGLVGAIQHFNTGGLASRISRATAPPIMLAGGGIAAPAAAASEMSHWGTVDLRHESGNFKVATERDTMRHLSANAQRAKRFSTGSKPSWYGGGG
jgi:hypothetical protein